MITQNARKGLETDINRMEEIMKTPNLLYAIRIAKENEEIALEYYACEAKNMGDLNGKKLFEQLSEFERFHYEKLSILEKSLEEKGDFISYEGKEFPLPPILDIKVSESPYRRSLMGIITAARELEKQAERAYTDLAAQLTDHPQGRKMFIKLSEEENKHYRILTDAYWSLNQTGVWKW